MRSIVVRAAPLALFAALAEWTAIDLYRSASLWGLALGGCVLTFATLAAVQATRAAHPALHRASRALLAVAFIGERILAAGIDVILMMAFLVLVMALASMQGLERTFGSVYDTLTDPALLRKVDSAAIGAYARAIGLLGFTFIVSLLLLNVFPLVALPSRNLAAVIGLALALLLVIAWLALSPSIPARRRV